MMFARSPILRIGGVLLAAACVTAAGCERLGLADGPMSPSGPPAPGATIAYTAVGASDASGIGSSAPCFLVDGAGCLGYVSVAARHLRAQGYMVTVTNLGIPTAAISPRLQQLGQQHGSLILGNFLDNEVPLIPRNTTAVTVFAGGNDANAILAAVNGGAAGNSVNTYIDAQIAAFGDDYDAVLDRIEDQVPDARIVLLNLPNLGALPYLGASTSARQRAQRLAVGMTTQVINPLYTRVTAVVDLMCEPRLYNLANLSGDGFHPNDAGYAIIAEKVAAAIAAAAYPPPIANCSQMTVS
jgi:lysophospholipase L1-like esterase